MHYSYYTFHTVCRIVTVYYTSHIRWAYHTSQYGESALGYCVHGICILNIETVKKDLMLLCINNVQFLIECMQAVILCIISWIPLTKTLHFSYYTTTVLCLSLLCNNYSRLILCMQLEGVSCVLSKLPETRKPNTSWETDLASSSHVQNTSYNSNLVSSMHTMAAITSIWIVLLIMWLSQNTFNLN